MGLNFHENRKKIRNPSCRHPSHGCQYFVLNCFFRNENVCMGGMGGQIGGHGRYSWTFLTVVKPYSSKNQCENR
jgi:hypothetical protein